MEVIKPSWIKHADDKNKRQCIFSADIDFENKRLATGGMNSVIRIWRLSSLFGGENGDGKGHLLASMTRHNGSVLCLRWSCHGLLASSSDDTIILIWKLDSRPASLRGNLEGLSDEGEVEENYKVVKRLIGHQSDTVGVEWSPDGRLLASCSLDGTICFWNADENSNQALIVKLEQAHKGFIKGLAWDPSGRFLASQSDDGSCAIWNVKNIMDSNASIIDCSDESEAEIYREVLLEDMFINTSKMTFFHRPSWSPDGTILALANAANRHIPVAALVESRNWQGVSTSFVGHLGPIEVVRFNPNLFTHAGRREMVCAVAGQDGQVSIWTSAHSGPIIVLQDLFEHSVMDLAWSRDGKILIAVSYDGTVSAVNMHAPEFDLIPLPAAEFAEHLRNAFGNRSGLAEGSQSGNYVESVQVIRQLHENEAFLTDQIKDMQIQSHIQSPTRENIAPPAQPVAAPMTLETGPAVQTVSVTRDGKKRITPQLLSMSSIPAGNLNTNTSFSSQSFNDAQPLTPNRSTAQRPPLMGHRLRDEDFLVHRKLMDSANSLLLGKASAKYNLTLSGESKDIPESLSFVLNKAFNVNLEIYNQDIDGKKAACSIQLIQGNNIQWKERSRGNVYFAVGNLKFCVFALKMGEHRHQLLVLSPAGRRVLPLICLDGRVIKMILDRDRLSAFTETGHLFIWDLSQERCLVSDCLPAGFSTSSTVIDFEVDIEFNVRLALNAADSSNEIISLQYNAAGRCWMERVQESSMSVAPVDPVARNERLSKLRSLCLNDAAIANDRHISELEFELSIGIMKHKNSGLKAEELAHLERVFAMYAVKLAKDSKVLKAQELLRQLDELGMTEVNQNLVKPILCQLNLSSAWQDFLASQQ